MKTYHLANDIHVFGFEVKSFPSGISESFDELINKTGDCAGVRSYFGIVKPGEAGKIAYYAVAEERKSGEAEKFHYNKYSIEKGEYLTMDINDWCNKTDSIKDIFHGLFQDNRVDRSKPCVEWYKDENEMLCMVKTTTLN